MSPRAGTAAVRARGAFALSIDTELAWGCFDRSDRDARFVLESRSREVVPALLELFARYEISATWAIVGHLFLDGCPVVDGGRPHPELPRPRYDWYRQDWFGLDPGGPAPPNSLWCAPDLVTMIAAATPRQEIASHSFSHLVYGDSGCPVDAADADLAACVSAARTRGMRLMSFVYPRNVVGHVELLARHGFECYRGEDPAWFSRLPGPLRRLGHYVDDLLARPPPTVSPQRQRDVWNIPGSMLFQGSDGLRRLIPDRARTRRCLAGLRRAIERQEIFHLWFHPVNFATRTTAMLRVFEPVLAAAAEARAAGRLDVLTMADAAREARAA